MPGKLTFLAVVLSLTCSSLRGQELSSVRRDQFLRDAKKAWKLEQKKCLRRHVVADLDMKIKQAGKTVSSEKKRYTTQVRDDSVFLHRGPIDDSGNYKPGSLGFVVNPKYDFIVRKVDTDWVLEYVGSGERDQEFKTEFANHSWMFVHCSWSIARTTLLDITDSSKYRVANIISDGDFYSMNFESISSDSEIRKGTCRMHEDFRVDSYEFELANSKVIGKVEYDSSSQPVSLKLDDVYEKNSDRSKWGIVEHRVDFKKHEAEKFSKSNFRLPAFGLPDHLAGNDRRSLFTNPSTILAIASLGLIAVGLLLRRQERK